MDGKIKETLEKQLELLSERAEKSIDTAELISLNHAINESIQIMYLLDRENQSRAWGSSRDRFSAQQSSRN